MREVTPAEQEDGLKALDSLYKPLQYYPGIIYIDMGYRYRDGEPTDDLAIRVHVYKKRRESELEDDNIIPKQIDNWPIDVIQSAPKLQNSPADERSDPVMGGIAIGNTRYLKGDSRMDGTLGMVVYDRKTGQPMGLSNYHVLVWNDGQEGDPIAQPLTSNAEDVVGILERWYQPFDCAVCTLDRGRDVSSAFLDMSPRSATAIAEPIVGMRVTKSGLTTGVTFGVIDGVTRREFTIVPDPDKMPRGAEISAGGDSGSVWLAADTSAAVGLHYAGELDPTPEGERAWAYRMVDVARELKIEVRPVEKARSEP
jgi:hypothetical protein